LIRHHFRLLSQVARSTIRGYATLSKKTIPSVSSSKNANTIKTILARNKNLSSGTGDRMVSKRCPRLIAKRINVARTSLQEVNNKKKQRVRGRFIFFCFLVPERKNQDRTGHSCLPIKAPSNDNRDFDHNVNHDQQQDHDYGQLWPGRSQLQFLGTNANQSQEQNDNHGREDVASIAMSFILACVLKTEVSQGGEEQRVSAVLRTDKAGPVVSLRSVYHGLCDEVFCGP